MSPRYGSPLEKPTFPTFVFFTLTSIALFSSYASIILFYFMTPF